MRWSESIALRRWLAEVSRCLTPRLWLAIFVGTLFILSGPPGSAAQEKGKNTTEYGAGLLVSVPFPQEQVLQIVQEVAQNGIIRGTKEYNKDEYVSGAAELPATKIFSDWTEDGKVFYKVRLKALNPQNFKGANDVGTLAVRYVVQAQDDKHTVLRIDARFIEDYRRISHASNGSVEGAEYKTIHDRLEDIDAIKARTAESAREKQEYLAKTEPTNSEGPAAPTVAESAKPKADSPVGANETTAPPQTLEQRVQNLRRQVQRLVKAPGAPLKAAPFHTASTLQSLPEGTEVLVEITTPYWLGVETHEGQHGWIMRDELELVP